MKLPLLLALCVALSGCAGTYDVKTEIPPDAGTDYINGTKSRATQTARGTFNLLGKGKLGLADKVTMYPDGTIVMEGNVHTNDSDTEKVADIYGTVKVTEFLERGLTARHKVDGATAQKGIDADVSKTRIENPVVSNVETEAVTFAP